MSGYEIEELGRIEDAIDALESPTSEDVFQALRPFDERAIGSVAAQRAGGGGSQTVLQAEVTISDADIRALTSEPYPVLVAPTAILDFSIPAPSIPVPLGGYVVSRLTDGVNSGYTNVNAAARLLIVVGSDWDAALMMTQVSDGRDFYSMLAGTQPHPQWFITPLGIEGVSGEWPIFSPDWLDNGLYVVLDNAGSGEVTGGDPGNQLAVTLFYSVADLT